jgi:CheY-like chemotaxis protein
MPEFAESTRRSGPSKTPAAVEGALVLIAEDNEINQIVAGELLRTAGYGFELVSNGEQAVEAARSGRFAAILMDCQMPVLDGFEAARRIRELEAGRGDGSHVRIIALTANAMKGDRERCLAAGMDGYVSKPINPSQLLETIAQNLAGWEPGRAAA